MATVTFSETRHRSASGHSFSALFPRVIRQFDESLNVCDSLFRFSRLPRKVPLRPPPPLLPLQPSPHPSLPELTATPDNLQKAAVTEIMPGVQYANV